MGFPFASGRDARLPRWAPAVTAAALMLAAIHLAASVRHLGSPHLYLALDVTTQHAAEELGSHALLQELQPVAGRAPQLAAAAAAASIPSTEAATAGDSGSSSAAAAAVRSGGSGGRGSSGGGSASASRQGDGMQLPAGTLGCELSGYCSVGRVRTWSGDISTNAALREMLEAVSYKKEIIITALNTPVGVWAEMAINLVKSAEALGLAHFVLQGVSEEVCAGLPPAFQHISCVWDSRPGADGSGVTRMAVFWAKRWETTARMLRMGYNVLIVDPDSMFHHDPYLFLKSPPLNKYTLLYQKDAPDGNFGAGVNCGVMYWQNAHPSGPAVWAVVEHTDRTYRQREAVEEMQSIYPRWDPFNHTWDQGTWNDMLLSLDSGEPRYTAVVDIANEEWKEEMDSEIAQRRLECVNVTWPAEWFNVTGIVPGREPDRKSVV